MNSFKPTVLKDEYVATPCVLMLEKYTACVHLWWNTHALYEQLFLHRHSAQAAPKNFKQHKLKSTTSFSHYGYIFHVFPVANFACFKDLPE